MQSTNLIILLSVLRQINENENQSKEKSLSPRLYLPDSSIGLTVWLQFAIACFG